MQELREQVWDHLYRSGPQSLEQIAASLQVAADALNSVIDHEWFETTATGVQIATRNPSSDSAT